MKQNLKLIRGDDTTLTMRLKQNNEPYLLDGVSRIDLHAKVKGKTMLELSTADGTIEHDGERILLHFTHALTAAAKWLTADYDVQLINHGKIKTVMYGRIDLQHDITQVTR